MSRELRFRAWDGRRMLLMGNGGDCDFEMAGGEIYVCGEFNFKKQDYPLMQYTGLKDKNGVGVYEGDLLINSRGRISEVVWHEFSASFDTNFVRDTKPEIASSMGLQNNMWKNSAEVIGNIHENPELLEAKT